MLIPPVFISTHINICKKINNNENNGEYLFPKYNIIKNQILNDMLTVLIYIIAVIFTIISIPFIWKLNKFLKILLELFKTYDYKQYFDNYFRTLSNCIHQIVDLGIKILLFPFVIIVTIINFIIEAIDLIYQIIFFSFAIILTIITIPFIWKLKKFIKDLIELFKTNGYKTFLVNYVNNWIECIYEILVSVLVILNHFSLIHLKALYDCYYGNKKKIKKSYLDICLIVFVEKWLDIFVFILSISEL